MRNIETISVDEVRGLDALLFDLDDTLLDHTELGEAAYSSLFRLVESGLALVAVTGRPCGWGEVLARQWPVAGVVTENGAIACAMTDGRFERVDFAGEARTERRLRLEATVSRLRAEFPALKATDDAHARLSDFAFDIGEHEHVSADEVTRVRAAAARTGARTIASSVHLHVTFDGLDKASGVTRFLHERLGWDPSACTRSAAFIGDSENDEACFGAFRTTIAVANFRGRPTVAPRFKTTQERGQGFAEAARVLVARRTAGGRAVTISGAAVDAK